MQLRTVEAIDVFFVGVPGREINTFGGHETTNARDVTKRQSSRLQQSVTETWERATPDRRMYQVLTSE
jgi:hypothetical protein